MIRTAHRRTLLFVFLSLALVASVLYDTLAVQNDDQWQIPLAALMAVSFAAVALFQPYPRHLIKPVAVATWPLHLFTVCFFGLSLAFHGGRAIDLVVLYTVFAYATYVLVPVLFSLDRQIFERFVKLVAILSAVLAIPSFFGALGFEHFLGLTIRVKPQYANLSGIIASGGLFEHPEGHAYQMAIGAFCCVYVLRKERSALYLGCLLLTVMGLVISQGRSAIYGVAVALAFIVLPDFFRRSRPAFIGTLVFLLAFPFLILPQLGSIPGVAGYLRIAAGLSGRGAVWRYALSVAAEKPWTGHGFMSSVELTAAAAETLRASGFTGIGSTFHNTFISKLVDLGIIATLLYALLYIFPLLRICRPSEYRHEQELIRSMILLVVATAIFRDYNIGGIRSTAMLGTIFLGMGNLWGLPGLWGQDDA
jgi:O-antigen ligase